MAIKIGTGDVSAVYLGTTKVDKIYIGTSLVWSGAKPVQLFNRTINRTATLAAAATAGVTFWTDGRTEEIRGASRLVVEPWLLSGAASDYEIRTTKVSGTTPNATNPGLGTWLSLSLVREWALRDSSQDDIPLTCELFIEIRKGGTTEVLASCTVSLSSNRTAI